MAISQTCAPSGKSAWRGAKLKSCLLAATILAITTLPVLAASGNWNQYLPGHGGNTPGHGGNARGAPAPIIGAGAGLPVLAVGYGIYWLTRRRRKSQ